ncbi:MAG: hypothetical protein M0006_01195 [Magnetospirillum sp.]|nr:hypothetical protein [Magnetospirillum sp.]
MCVPRVLNRRHLLSLVPGLVAAAALSGPLCACGGGRTGPVAVRWGKENCDYCGMIIDDPHFAAEIRGPGGKLWKFDDIGCGAMFLCDKPWSADPHMEFWAGDVERGTWLDGRLAWYVAGPKSPMSYNFGAVAVARAGALSFADFRKAVAAHGSTGRCEHPAPGA